MKILVILFAITIIAFIVYAIANKIKNDKIISIGLFLVLIVMISIFTDSQRNIEKQHAKIMNLFNRNIDINCNEIKVNKKEFNFISGTLVFIGKEKSSVKGQIIPLDECSIFE